VPNPYSVIPVAERRAGEFAYEAGLSAMTASAGRSGSEIFAPQVRHLIEESWKRSLDLHLDPDRISPSFDLDDQTLRQYRREHPLALVLPVIHRLLIQHTFDTGLIIAVGDQSGRLLWIDGDRDLRRQAEGMLFVEGANWSEAAVGTSAPGTALALDHGIQIGGPEHFNRIVHPWSCTAVPVHDPATGEILGVVDITGGESAVLPTTLPLLEAAVAAAEAELRIHQLTTHHDLHRAAGRVIAMPGADHSAGTAATVTRDSTAGVTTGSTSAGATPGTTPAGATPGTTSAGSTPGTTSAGATPRSTSAGATARTSRARAVDAPQLSVLGRELARLNVGSRTTELSARHSELLTLLAWHRHGLSAERLAHKLYANENSVATLRAEIVRLRAVLADSGADLRLHSRPYRLDGALDLDAHRVLAFLERGAHRVALAAYPGPVLLGSTAPGIVDIRREVSGNVRESLLADGSAEVLLDYARTDECVYDRDVWLQCLRRLPARSPKRASVLARIERIDSEVGRS
jgi:hypothetical protein